MRNDIRRYFHFKMICQHLYWLTRLSRLTSANPDGCDVVWNNSLRSWTSLRRGTGRHTTKKTAGLGNVGVGGGKRQGGSRAPPPHASRQGTHNNGAKNGCVVPYSENLIAIVIIQSTQWRQNKGPIEIRTRVIGNSNRYQNPM
jgi:hypothetical protein